MTFGIGSSLGLLMTAHLIVRGFASNSGTGSIAALGYAFRLYEVPLSLIANPAAVLMLPNIAILYKAGDMAAIGDISRRTLLAGLVILFAAAAVTWISADLIVHVLLERGNFGADAAQLTADALRGFAPAIVGEGIIVVFYRLFYAVHRPSRAVVSSCVALVGLVVLLLVFGNVAFIAVPLSLSGGFLIGAIALIYFIARDIGITSLPSLASLSKWVGCTLLALAACKSVKLYETGNIWSEFVMVLVFMFFYSSAILVSFADYRQILLKVLSVFARRIRRFLGSA